MNDARPQPVSYGPATFVAALVNILIVEVALWLTVPWIALAVFVVPLLVVVVDVVVAAILTSRSGTLSQVGRGMLIGLIAAPATLVVFLPGFFLAQAFGLV
ncbi:MULTISPECIES: hypothetical protein [Mycobacteriaceae]|uniref:Uncharacterized protein n=1 Tax=Mycolicibacterium parafortuitum TaxID=39692 RepID=A0ACC6MP09_MYCPF|nr:MULTISPECIES: hypothetical protein [Mycobacteriaceae]MDZ5088742.1 hypothetical protein [Mycolicibacterium parafortuitum]